MLRYSGLRLHPSAGLHDLSVPASRDQRRLMLPSGRHLTLPPPSPTHLTPTSRPSLPPNAHTRYILDVCSDVLVYLVAWITFAEDTTTANKFVDPGDASNFKTITITVLVVGTFFSVLFHLFTPERASTRTQAEAYQEVAASETQAETSPTTSTPQQEEQPVNSYTAHVRMMWKDWLAEPQFYQASVVVGIVIGLVAATVSALPWIPEFGMYIVAILWGTSSSILVIISLAFTADLIGRSTESSAFVYGSMSFADKIINGVAVLIIQELTSLGIFVPLMTAFIAICLINRQRLGRTQKLLQAERETGEASGSSLSSNSSELLLSTGTNLGYGAITKA
ncbi:Major facilitator superfamily domain-containing protein 12-like 3 [Homarus americanus]|uniref:Major facilitator superfamily domain-containing protein 12-like 3 n=1 Tax=Homarus americanus TaxID=6706 RepID=A0A8J5N0A5_HOMAM|nr:Major facilitator superfamily domain-containing protein 12-like 3 [Homarus americanus]